MHEGHMGYPVQPPRFAFSNLCQIEFRGKFKSATAITFSKGRGGKKKDKKNPSFSLKSRKNGTRKMWKRSRSNIQIGNEARCSRFASLRASSSFSAQREERSRSECIVRSGKKHSTKKGTSSQSAELGLDGKRANWKKVVYMLISVSV